MILNKCLKYLLHWCFRSSRSNNNIDPVYNLVRNLLAETREERGERREERRGWLRDRKVVKHRDLHIYDVGGGGGGSDHPPPFRCWWCIERRYLGIFTVRWSHHTTPPHTSWWTAMEGGWWQSFTPHYQPNTLHHLTHQLGGTSWPEDQAL